MTGNKAAAYAELAPIYQPGHMPTTDVLYAAMMLALSVRDRNLLLRTLDDSSVGERQTRGVPFYASIKERLDRPDSALAFLRPLVKPGQGTLELLGISMFLAYFADTGKALEAFDLLNTRMAIGNPQILANWDPLYRDVRKLAGYKKLVRDVGLVGYWREHGKGDYCEPRDPNWDDFDCQ
jgi:hypothetical protein